MNSPSLYIRYRDDLLIIFQDAHLFGEWFREFKRLAAVAYRIYMEAWSKSEINMLDVTVFKGVRFRARSVLDVKPYKKDSSRKVPLAPSSAHPRAVHESWPKAEVYRLRARSGSAAIFAEAKSELLTSFSHHGLLESVVARASAIEYHRPPPKNPATQGVTKTFWLKLPYSPILWMSSLQGVLKGVVERWAPFVEGIRGPVEIRVAWCAGGPSLQAMSYNGRKFGVGRWEKHSIAVVQTRG